MTTATLSNMTLVVGSKIKATDTIRIFLTVLISVFCRIFFLFISYILHILFTTPHIREHARYILFAHMPINDALYILNELFISMVSKCLPVPVCYLFVSLATITFRITPHNLAAMALERYAAVCFPLRHVTLSTPQKSKYAIAIIWFIDLIPSIIDFIILCSSVDKRFLTLCIICTREHVTGSFALSILRSGFLYFSLVLVGLIIAFTYVRVTCIAKKVNSHHSSAQKAGKTLMLNTVQFLLCSSSLTSLISEHPYKNTLYFPLINCMIFMCLPQFFNPLIYGLRDEILRKHIRNVQLI